MNLLPTIEAKSDQLNADDLLGGPRTITVTGIKGNDSAEQPVSIHYEGDNGKPFKPCKTSRRLLVHCWGPEASEYVGRRMTLYCDQNVMFGGIKVGGIRISHMSHIDREMVVPLMVTRGKRAPHKVLPLKAEVTQATRRQDARQAEGRPSDFPGDQHDHQGDAGGGFGGGEPQSTRDWATEVQRRLQADEWTSVRALDDFTQDQQNIRRFLDLQEEDPERARALDAALRGRRKALADRARD